jgi:hypothetical protein
MTERHISEGGMCVPRRLRTHALAAGPRGHSRDAVEQRYYSAHTGIEIACVGAHGRSVRCAARSTQGPATAMHSPQNTLYTPEWRW